MTTTARVLADEFGLRLEGEGSVVVKGVAPLERAGAGEISFCRDRKHYPLLEKTRAAAVILDERAASKFTGTKLISRNPHADFARIATYLHPDTGKGQGIDPTARVAEDVRISPTATIGCSAFVGARTVIGDDAIIGPFCYVGNDVVIGANTRLVTQVTVMDRCRIGQRSILYPGSVIGSDGFGYALDQGQWIKVPQLGTVLIGNDVEIGANTTVDRGALDDTIVEDGVKIDNLVQIGHNVRIGENTIIVASVGVGGSTVIGRRCVIAGGVMIAGHIRIADDVTVQATSLVATSIDNPGVYSAHVPAMPVQQWRRALVRLQRLDTIARRLEKIERQGKPVGKEEED